MLSRRAPFRYLAAAALLVTALGGACSAAEPEREGRRETAGSGGTSLADGGTAGGAASSSGAKPATAGSAGTTSAPAGGASSVAGTGSTTGVAGTTGVGGGANVGGASSTGGAASVAGTSGVGGAMSAGGASGGSSVGGASSAGSPSDGGSGALAGTGDSGSNGGACAAGLTRCNGACVDTTGHQSHCGVCGNACPADQMCSMSSCRCRTGQASCNGGACQDVLADEANCGACGTVCASGATCTAGACVCPAGETVCSGTCVNPTTDGQNCGTCGTKCGGGTSCSFGACIDPNSVNCGGDAQANRSCTKDAYVLLGKYWVNNNQWGTSGASGQQCIFSTCQTGDLVGWGTDWQWSGGGNGVKTYVSLVFGWQWGWRVTNTGLPIQLSSGKKVSCGWSFTVNPGGVINVSYDMWLHTTANPDSNSTPTDEVMVWLYAAGGAGPIGTKQATVTIGGAAFDLYRGQNGSTNVFSFVRTANATTAVLDMTSFTGELVTRGWLQSSKYLASVQAGTEVYSGSGSLTTNGFYCRVQ